MKSTNQAILAAVADYKKAQASATTDAERATVRVDYEQAVRLAVHGVAK